MSVGWPESLSCRVDGGLTIISKVPAVDEVGEALVVAGAQDRRHADNTVAESSAFVALNHYGIDTGSYSFPYVARWAADKEVFKRNLDEVQKVSAALIEGIDAAKLEE